MTPIELWGGVECTVNRVGDRYFDQVERSGHADRLDDLDRIAALGIRTLRYPLLWERIAGRAPGEYDWTWPDARLARMTALGLRPVAGLVHHGSGPRWTSLIDPAFPALLAGYARAVAERYPAIDAWTPVNEPLTTARFSALYGHWYPHARDTATFVRALLTQLRGVVLAMREIRAVNPAARLVQTEDCGVTYGTRRVEAQVRHEQDRRWLTWDLLSGRVDPAHPMTPFLTSHGATEADLAFFREEPCVPDVIGLNYYVTSDRWLDDRVERYPEWSRGGNADLAYADVEAVRARWDGLAGHEAHLMDAWTRYGRPLAVTEVHLGCTREEQLRWLVEAWRAAHAAQARGADVRAVTAWALFGSHDWNTLVTRETGHYEPGAFDVRGSEPRATALATVVRELGSAGHSTHAGSQGAGWWNRPERLQFGPRPGAAPPGARGSGQPMLVLGSNGTLGTAFRRMCAARGLAVHLVGRHDVDIADPARVDAVLRTLRPWAVVNAAGYVKVDQAEGERDACWRDNVAGPVTLAAACHRRGLPLVTFSSDLVFDGTLGRPYVESDAVHPLNVYGESKAESERRVLELHPDALVVRTSAFFGPWDDWNFATVMARAVLSGAPYACAHDVTVSPTYVPHLVETVLDLLIDGERGLWHLANDGAVTWFEFAQALAARLGGDPQLLVAAPAHEIWAPAQRPRMSALGSARARLLPALEAAMDDYVRRVASVAGGAGTDAGDVQARRGRSA